MKTIPISLINDFLNSQNFVLFGVSENKQKFGNTIFKELSSLDIKIFPIHKSMQTFENQRCYKSIEDLPSKPQAAIVCTKSDLTEAILSELSKTGIDKVWLQQGAANREIIDKFEKEFSVLISGKCILMFANQRGIHKFHSQILRFFGKYPR
jgi:uncharacterized protein